jgi:orotate phosphoribosyltransferase
MDETKQKLIDHLLEHSVRTGDFTLKSGRKSSWFIDSKQTACRPEGLLLIADLALGIIPDDVTAIGGLTVGADPVAYGIAGVAATRGRDLRSFTIRKEAKDHGVAGRLAGPLLPGDKVVITEDTVTRGTSPMEAVQVVRDLGAEPVMILVVVDRGGSCAALAEAAGIEFRALVTAPELGFGYEGA